MMSVYTAKALNGRSNFLQTAQRGPGWCDGLPVGETKCTRELTGGTVAQNAKYPCAERHRYRPNE